MSDTTSVPATDDAVEVDVEFDPTTGEVAADTAGTELATYSDPVVESAIQALRSGSGLAYSSITGTDWDSKMKTLSAVTNSSPVKRHVDEVINLKDIVVQKVALKNRANPNGPRIIQPRVILLDTDGNAYHATSPVLLGSVGNFIGILGEPHTWPESGVPTKIVARPAATGEMYLIEPVAVKIGSKK